MKYKNYLLIGCIFGLVSIIILFYCICYVIALNPQYDFRIRMISGLGLIEGKEIFNMGMIFSGILLFPFFISLRKYFEVNEGNDKYIMSFACLSGIIFCFSLIGVGIFPAGLKFGFQHVRVAFFFFNSVLFTTFLFSMLLIHNDETKEIAYYGIGSSFFTFLFLYFRIPFFEWIMFIGFFIWVLYVIIFMLVKVIIKI